MAKAGQLVVDLIAETQQFRADMAQASRDAAQNASAISRSLSGINDTFDLLKRGAEAFGLALGVREFVDFVQNTAAAALQLKELSATLGVSTTDLQGLRIAADETGVSQEALQTGLDRFTRSVGLAAEGNKAALKTFNDLHVGVLDSNNAIRPTKAVLDDVATALSKITDPARRATAEVALFGRSGQLLDPVLRAGGAALDDMTQKASDAGEVIDSKTVDALSNLEGKIQEMEQAWRVAGANLVADLEPEIEKVVKLFADAADKISSLAGGIAFGSVVNSGNAGTAEQIGRAREQLEAYNQDIARLTEAEKTEGALAAAFTEAEITGLKDKTAELQKFIDLSTSATARPPQSSIIGGPSTESYPSSGGNASHNPPPAGGVDKAQQVVDQLKFEAEQLGRTAEQQRIYNDLRKAGTTEDTAAGRQIVLLDEILQDHADALKSDKVVEGLRFEADQLGRNATQQKIYNDLKAAGVTIDSDAGRQIVVLDNNLAALKANQEAYNKDLEDAKRIHEEILTPQQKYNDNLQEAETLLKDHLISLADYDAYLTKIKDDLDKSTSSLGSFAQSFLEGERNAKTWQDAIKNAIDSVINELIKLLEQTDKTGGGSSGGANWLQSLFSSFGSLLGIGGGVGSAAGGVAVPGALAGAGGVGAGLQGYAQGGTFDVAGGGAGTDSQLVAFRATPGERVTVSDPSAGTRAGGQMVYSPKFYISTPNPDAFHRAHGQIVTDGYRHMQRAARRSGA